MLVCTLCQRVVAYKENVEPKRFFAAHFKYVCIGNIHELRNSFVVYDVNSRKLLVISSNFELSVESNPKIYYTR